MTQQHKRHPWVLIGLLVLGCSHPSRDRRSRADDVQARDPDQAQTRLPAPPLALSAAPSDGEFQRLGLFALPLVPVGRTAPDENRGLARALTAYERAAAQSGDDAVAPLSEFLQAHRDSAWKPALLVNLGTIYRQTGHFSKALDSWQRAWESTKRLDDPDGRALADAALGQLSQLQAYFGRKEELEPLLAEIKNRPLRGSAAALVSEAARALADMKSAPELAFKCGPFALSRILQYNRAELPFAKVAIVQAAHSTSKGLSLSALHELSERAGMGYQMAFRTSAASMVVPAVVHWKVGHYAAIVAAERGRYRVQDSAFGEDILVSPTTLDEEASGYFLIPNGPLPAHWRKLGQSEAGDVWGRGDAGALAQARVDRARMTRARSSWRPAEHRGSQRIQLRR
jgi:tetratricopeptide (TPR) repeat protein